MILSILSETINAYSLNLNAVSFILQAADVMKYLHKDSDDCTVFLKHHTERKR
jgi:hypothetical protein